MDNKTLEGLRELVLPDEFEIDRVEQGVVVQRLKSPSRVVGASFSPLRYRGATCRRAVAMLEDDSKLVLEFASFNDEYADVSPTAILRGNPVIDGTRLSWERVAFLSGDGDLAAAAIAREQCRTAWKASGINYRSELLDAEGQLIASGLRLPQSGALHAIAAHWTTGSEKALVVMPTGTGKTEVMIAAAVEAACDRVLIIVPSDALRLQTANRFASYSVLQHLGTVTDLPNPVIGLLSSRPTPEQFPAIEACNVVVATMSAIGLASEDTQRRLAALFSHIFFDEAHHIEAATWKRFQKVIDRTIVLLFTATPFREDGKSLDGKMIYEFPLALAQAHGFFQNIRFKEVFQPNGLLSDASIAESAVEALREDLAAGYDHILMARASTINAADDLYRQVYAGYEDLNPVVIHSRTPNRQGVLSDIRARKHRIVVCVNMFGEGFDLPQLKVAALHSPHKSLGITLQFIGRFARTTANVGPATFIANTADDGVSEALESLYLEDADWNALLSDLSFSAIDSMARLSDLVEHLETPAAAADEELDISALALRPKLSTQVYRTDQFEPGRYAKAFRAAQKVHQPQISLRDNFLVLIVNQKDGLDWTDSKDISIDSWDLFIAKYDPELQLLYIHSSRKGDAGGTLAKAISHDSVLIKEEEVFKAFSGLKRLVLHNVGLSSLSRNVRYQMFAGLDVRNAIDPLQQQSKRKSNITGVGYEEGTRRSVGCSRKGKIWSLTSGTLADWIDWCDSIGKKLVDPAARHDDFLRHTLIPTAIVELPNSEALLVDWPDQLFESSTFRFEVRAAATTFGFHDCELDLVEWAPGDSFTFVIKCGEDVSTTLRLTLREDTPDIDGYLVEKLEGPDAEIDATGERASVQDFFQANPPLVRLADGSQLSGNILLKPQEELPELYDLANLSFLDWRGVDLAKESRWKNGVFREDSIQHRFVEHLLGGPATFIIDDDDTGESADIVAIEETDDTITVFLWHLKYSRAEMGRRADDLYVVCGQAQKGVKWTWSLKNLINHLTVRETSHLKGRDTRFVRGSLGDLATLRKASRRKFVEYRIGIVQPGLNGENIPAEHLALLGATSSFIQTVTGRPLLTVANRADPAQG
ncbi:DEAD/DEAH box helicase [Methylocystis parvus]|uniref:DEAD/DEAH box helicase n=1 Tax=Methylocystis parvus TaxID=134 RepID=A0A6B8ME92_9HYPH|nr:DEAD/DEAH box helicase family protein [Methylocystis parvus]QGM99879.1 DEAD/DEAH box helicase [Methylocystis parvus]WBK02302.1 DEAD/DEAH box helicase family protein [Methylocystis parvus OBBP]